MRIYNIDNIIRETVNQVIKTSGILTESSEEKMKPSKEWMEKRYDEMNRELFNNELGSCVLDVFISGKGSKGNSLGKFRMKGKNLYIENNRDRRLFIQKGYNSIYINRSNFEELCEPVIELNGNYNASEESLLNTLIHEMCHYYTYMNGYAPVQAHGTEFRNIAGVVSRRSNGRFVIQRLATAEEMEDFELDSDILDKKLKNMNAVLIFMPDNEVRAVTTTSKKLISELMVSEPNAKEIRVYKDERFLRLFNKYIELSNSRTYSYWIVNKYPEVMEKLDDYPYETSVGKTDDYLDVVNIIYADNKFKKSVVVKIIDSIIKNLDSYEDEDEWSAVNYIKNFNTVINEDGNRIKLEFKFSKRQSGCKALVDDKSILFKIPFIFCESLGDDADGYILCHDGGDNQGKREYYNNMGHMVCDILKWSLLEYIEKLYKLDDEDKESKDNETKSEPEPKKVNFNGNFAIIKEMSKFNIIDKVKKKLVFANPVDEVINDDNVWIYRDGRIYYMAKNEPYNWKKVAKKI